MKKLYLFLTFVFIMATTASFAGEFTLTSNDISGQLTKTQEFIGFGCTGKNISPQLAWNNAPKDTKSFAVTVYDPDAPTGSGWWHWVIFNIPSTVHELKTNAGDPAKKIAPHGSVQSRTDYGKTGFGGACPPQNDKPHAYIFTVFALNTDKIGLDENASPALVGFMLNAHTIAKASIVAYYSR